MLQVERSNKLNFSSTSRPSLNWFDAHILGCYTEVVQLREQLPEFKLGEVVRQTRNYQIIMDYKWGIAEADKERFFLVPLNRKANTLLESAAKLHHINTEKRKFPKDKEERTWVRMDYSQENWDTVITHDCLFLPGERGEDSVPPVGYLEKLLKEGKRNYKFPDVIIHAITVRAGSRK